MWREFEIKIHFEGQEDKKKAQKNRAKSTAENRNKKSSHDMTKKCQK